MEAAVKIGAAPPQNLEAESSVLGAVMVAEVAIDPVIADVRLMANDFYREQHRIIFRAITSLYERREPIDPLTVSEHLAQKGEIDQVGGREYVHSLASTVPAAANAAHYAKIVKENALLRRLLETARSIQSSVEQRQGEPRELVEQAESALFKVAHEEKAGDFQHVGQILHDELDKLQLNTDSVTGVESGFTDLDDMTGGFRDGNLIVLAARPSMGKSALVANIAENASVKHGRKVALFSLEMSQAELAQRFIACRARIPGDRLRKGKVAQKDWPHVIKACGDLDRAELWIDDSTDLTMLEIRAKSRRLAARQGLDLVIVDYLQLMRPDTPSDSRVEQVGKISRGLKILAGDLNIPVIAVSQLNRSPEQRPSKRPLLADLRESGNIEQDADLVMFIYRDEYYHGEESEKQGLADIIISKHRNGPVGETELAFLSHYPKFADRAREEMPIEQVAGEGPPMEAVEGI